MTDDTNILTPDMNKLQLSSEDAKQCAQACDNNPQCAAWAFQHGTRFCFLKNSKGDQQPGWTGFVSGFRGEGGSSGSENIDLTGTWSCDDGGRYYIRQLGNIIWWDADGTTGSWGNVAHGTIRGNTIRPDYADVPEGTANGFGTLVLDVISNNELKVTEKPASYGGSHLQRMS